MHFPYAWFHGIEALPSKPLTSRMSRIESPTCYEVPDSQPRTQEEWDYYFPPKLQVSSSSRPTSEEKPAIDHDVLQISDDEKEGRSL